MLKCCLSSIFCLLAVSVAAGTAIADNTFAIVSNSEFVSHLAGEGFKTMSARQSCRRSLGKDTHNDSKGGWHSIESKVILDTDRCRKDSSKGNTPGEVHSLEIKFRKTDGSVKSCNQKIHASRSSSARYLIGLSRESCPL